MTPLEQALDYVFKNEGGFANVKGDRGGATKYGITISTLARWRGHRVSVESVRNLSEDEAKDIYAAWYWSPQSLHSIDSLSKAICMFDIGIVRGISIGSKYAQMVCNTLGGKLLVDGDIGPMSVEAINAADTTKFVLEYSKRAEQGFRNIVASNPTQKKFLKGWINRAVRLKTLANSDMTGIAGFDPNLVS